MDLPVKIRELRKARGMTIAELAGKVGVSIPHMSQVERGIKNLNNHLLTRIATALDVEPYELIGGSQKSDYDALMGIMSDLNDEDRARVLGYAEALAKKIEAS